MMSVQAWGTRNVIFVQSSGILYARSAPVGILTFDAGVYRLGWKVAIALKTYKLIGVKVAFRVRVSPNSSFFREGEEFTNLKIDFESKMFLENLAPQREFDSVGGISNLEISSQRQLAYV